MLVVRWSVLVAVAGVAAGCAGPPLVVLAPAPTQTVLDSSTVAVTLFLIGDAGHAQPGDRVLAELARQGKAARRGSAIVFLGDNVYPAGIPPEADPRYPEMRRRLYTQASLSPSTGLALFFIPGNHDWDRQREPGWASIQRQDLLLRRYADSTGAAVRLTPRGGCPGPELFSVGPSLRLVAIDTPWWLHQRSKPGSAPPGMVATMPDPITTCPTRSEPEVVDSLRKIHATPSERMTVVVGHHPIESSGEHGGRHPWIQYLFPFVPTPLAKWAWLPIGWIYPIGRRLVGHPQDLTSGRNRSMREAIEGTFGPASPLIYAAGHDHSLEVVRRGPGRFLLVSGAGTENHQSAVGRGDSTAFASRRPGFMRVDVLTDGRVRLGVTELDDEGRPREAYRAWLRN